ncbi:MAG: hypothetical protein ACHP85_20455 [Burkholderiales bacterium]
MKPHLTDEAVLDLALGEAGPADRAHAAACEACGARREETRAALELARQAEVPEPSPLYWQALRSGVSRRIAEAGGAPRRFGVLVPLAAAAGLLAAVLSLRSSPPQQPSPSEPRLPAWSALPLEEEDDGLRVLEGLALASGDVGDWQAADGLEGYLESLTDDESRRLADSLRQQGQGGES